MKVDKATIEFHKMLTDKLVKHGLLTINAQRVWLAELEDEPQKEKSCYGSRPFSKGPRVHHGNPGIDLAGPKGTEIPVEEPKLLTIELDDIDSVPVVHYKGEELGPKTELDFSWSTKTLDDPGHVAFDIEHVVEGGRLEKQGFRGKGYYISSEQKGYPSGGEILSVQELQKMMNDSLAKLTPDIEVENVDEIGESEPFKGSKCNIQLSGMDIVHAFIDHFENQIGKAKRYGS